MQLLLDFFFKILLIDGIIFVLIILGALIITPFNLIKENMLKQAIREEIKKGIKDGSIKLEDLNNTDNMFKYVDTEDKKSK